LAFFGDFECWYDFFYVVFQLLALVFDISLPEQLVEQAANYSNLGVQKTECDFMQGYVQEAMLKDGVWALTPHPLCDALACPTCFLASLGPTKATGAPLSFACIR
jgi:hypothetical protein